MKKLLFAMIVASTIAGIAFYAGNPSENEVVASV